MHDFPDFFQARTGFRPHSWQARLGADASCSDRLIRIPTGYGKTAGVSLAWLYHRVHRGDLAWPTRLVVALPMRVLVEQSWRALRAWCDPLDVDVHPVMGGSVSKEYATRPERPTVLVGTQDMLLSRALNRGYAAARGRWPVDFGLLHHDALWVLDEVQLMDTGLATSAQLAAFRQQRSEQALRPSYSWWMSATLQPDWLATVDLAPAVDALTHEKLEIRPANRQGPLWQIRKPTHRQEDASPEAVVQLIQRAHRPGSLTLVVVNRVDRAVEIDELLREEAPEAEVRLVHSRFRPHERQGWEFLQAGAEVPSAGRVVIATQVVEAGVDISARTLISDLAPWPSLVQRVGRAARREGEHAEVYILGNPPEDPKEALPYQLDALVGAHRALTQLEDLSLAGLERFEREADPELLQALYPYTPTHMLRRDDLHALFDTAPDLSGSDLDVGRYIRSGQTTDVSVCWRGVPAEHTRKLSRAEFPIPHRDELCPVPVGRARAWFKLLRKREQRLWRFDFVEGCWTRLSLRDLRRIVPGQILLVDAEAGGYRPHTGFSPQSKQAVEPVSGPPADPFDLSSLAAEDDSLSRHPWKTIATHVGECADVVQSIAGALGLPDRLHPLLHLAARWHDVGKAHGVFQAAISEESRDALEEPGRKDLAKAPDEAWGRYGRRGFRHELASVLALFELLRRTDPTHDALIGEVRHLLALLPGALEAPPAEPHPLGAELAALSAAEIDLVAWLVVTHHGKVRATWAGTPTDRDRRAQGSGSYRVHGVEEGDRLPPVGVPDAGGQTVDLPGLRLDLSLARLGLDPRFGRSWTDRSQRLLDRHGPFQLAFLEAVLRAADVRASRLDTRETC